MCPFSRLDWKSTWLQDPFSKKNALGKLARLIKSWVSLVQDLRSSWLRHCSTIDQGKILRTPQICRPSWDFPSQVFGERRYQFGNFPKFCELFGLLLLQTRCRSIFCGGSSTKLLRVRIKYHALVLASIHIDHLEYRIVRYCTLSHVEPHTVTVKVFSLATTKKKNYYGTRPVWIMMNCKNVPHDVESAFHSLMGHNVLFKLFNTNLTSMRK